MNKKDLIKWIILVCMNIAIVWVVAGKVAENTARDICDKELTDFFD